VHSSVGWFEAVVLGIVQGLTEFLPISSNAHQLIVSRLAGWGDPGAAFTAVNQLGTEAAVLVYFRKEIWAIIRTWTLSLFRPELRGEPDARMGWYVIVGTIPIGVLGLLLQDPIESAFRNLYLVAASLIVFALVLAWADATAVNEKPLSSLNFRDSVLYGLAQSLALIPGVSRSGGTISGGLLMGYTRAAAARYSFLLAIPAVLASGLFELRKIGDTSAGPAAGGGQTLLATVIAFVVGYAVIAWFLKYVANERHSFKPFVWYRIGLGVVVVVLCLTGVLTASG
jgi:undecaprenyl-diphosphatase